MINITFHVYVHGGKAFAAEQKIKELKKRISKVKTISDQSKAKISLARIINHSAENMKNVKSEKYKLTPNEIEKKKSLENQQFRTEFNFEHIKISKKTSDRLDRYHKKLYSRKKKKLREELNVGEKVLILAERLQRKSAPGKFYKQTVQNISYFNKENIFIIRNKTKIEDKTFIG